MQFLSGLKGAKMARWWASMDSLSLCRKLFLSSWELLSGAGNGLAESDASTGDAYSFCSAWRHTLTNWPVPNLHRCWNLWVMWMSQSHFSAAGEDKIYFFLAWQPVTALVGLWCFGGSLWGVAFLCGGVVRPAGAGESANHRWGTLGSDADVQIEVAFQSFLFTLKW